MKKRFVTTLLALIACIACVVGLVACGDGTADPVAGKTYVFEKVEITKGASGAVKEESERVLNEMFKNDYIEFGTDGSFTIAMYGQPMSGTYKQSGATVTATIAGEDQKIKVSGDTVSMSGTQNGIGMKMIYKLVKEEEGEISSPTDNVAGKTYVYDTILLTFDDSIDSDTRQQAEAAIEPMKAAYEGATIVFDNNGGFTMTVSGSAASGTYTQNGATLTLTANSITLTYKVIGGAIQSETKTSGITTTTYYQLQED